jgi:hypothetical protein
MTKKSPILSGSRAITAALRDHFVAHNVECFDTDDATSFSFGFKVNEAAVAVFAEIELPTPRVRLLTCLVADVEVPQEHCTLLANFLNLRSRFATVVFPEETGHLAVESSLVLGDEKCLRAQLEEFAFGHMNAVLTLTPLLDGFSRGEFDQEELAQRLALVVALTEQPAPSAGPKHRNVAAARLHSPGRN